MKKLAFLFFMVSCSLAGARGLPLDTVEFVELNRYLGKWYEISRFEQKFQKGCTATEANYSLRPDGDIKVINRCNLNSPDGKLKESEGRAWIVDENSNAKLKVQFFALGRRLPLFAGNYWILDLDENYNHVIVGDKSRKYLWILSRNKVMDDKTYNNLVNKAKSLKFDVSKLVKTIH